VPEYREPSTNGKDAVGFALAGECSSASLEDCGVQVALAQGCKESQGTICTGIRCNFVHPHATHYP